MARESITGGATAGGTRRAATHYGVRTHEVLAPACHSVEQGIEKLVIPIDVSTGEGLPTFGQDELIQRVGADCRFLSASLRIIEDFVGGTDVTVGAYEPDGTVIIADGLIATQLTAALVAGAIIDGAGALLGAGTTLGVEAQVVVAATGTYTAGVAELIVEFECVKDRTELNR